MHSQTILLATTMRSDMKQIPKKVSFSLLYTITKRYARRSKQILPTQTLPEGMFKVNKYRPEPIVKLCGRERKHFNSVNRADGICGTVLTKRECSEPGHEKHVKLNINIKTRAEHMFATLFCFIVVLVLYYCSNKHLQELFKSVLQIYYFGTHMIIFYIIIQLKTFFIKFVGSQFKYMPIYHF